MPEVREAENSEALVHDEGETVRLEWTVHGTRRTVLVAFGRATAGDR